MGDAVAPATTPCDRVNGSVGVGFFEQFALESGGENAGERRAVKNVFVFAAQSVLQRYPGNRSSVNLLIELGKFLTSEAPPGVRCRHRDERSAFVSARVNPTSRKTGSCRCVRPPRDRSGGDWRSCGAALADRLLVVAKRGGRQAGSLGELIDSEQPIRHIDFKRT
jgi:hypothetical protein